MNKHLFSVVLAMLLPNLSNAGGTWTALNHAPPVGVNNCLLLSDGTVLGMNGAGQCVKLTPDIHGSYVNGTWTSLPSMNDSRLFFSSVMLTNGNVYVAGGEYGNADGYAELYNPLANTWSIIQPGLFFSDACAMMLPNGNVLQSDSQSGYWIYNVAANTIAHAGSCEDMNETCWVRLANDNVLALTGYSVTSEHYVPSLNAWYADNNSPVPLFGYGAELGAAFTLPNGNVLQIGGTTNTAIYTPAATLTGAGSWVAGPGMPNNLGAVDAPAAMMVNGNILLDIGPVTGFGGPCYFYEYNYVSNSFTQVTAPGGGSTYGGSPFVNSMLCLPDGSVLLVGGQNSGSLYVYTPDGTPLAAGQPSISSITENADGSYHLTGVGLAGISRGAAYGDDEQMDSNYPLLRMTNSVSGYVYYARTYGWSSTTIQNPNPVTTEFVLPQALPAGTYSLGVVANGNPSAPQTFVYSPPPVPTGLTAISGSNALVNLSWDTVAGATTYNLKRSLSSTGYFATIATLSGTNYSDTGLTNEVDYYYKVAAVGPNGPSSDSGAVSAIPFGPPPIPTGLTAVPATFERINLTWNASYGATNYNIQRSTIHNGPYTNVASSINPAYTDNGLTSGTTYYYVVSAVSSEGESSNSVEASATAQAIGNFGFETPGIGGGNYQYNPSGAGWAFSGSPGNGSGILGNGSAFSNPNAPQGVQAAFLQGHGVISQVLSGFTPGTTYTITYSAAQRPGNNQTWNVMIDGTVIGSNSGGGTSYATTTAGFVATAVTHTLFFVGTDLAGGDNTVFIDNVSITPPPTSGVALPVLTQDTLPATAATVVGDSVTLTAGFANVPAANYQWQFISTNGGVSNLAGATSATLTVSNLQLSSSGYYRLEAINATNSLGVLYSDPSPLTVSSVPGAANNVVTRYAAQTGHGTNFTSTWSLAPGSMINGQVPSSTNGNFSLEVSGRNVNSLTDGSLGAISLISGSSGNTTSMNLVTCGNGGGAGSLVIYSLTNLSSSGFNLNDITVYGGWADAGRDQQAYTVYYSTVAAPSTFISLGSVNYNPVDPANAPSATRASLTPATGWLATNVAAVKFDFTNPSSENGYCGYAQIQLFGASVIPVVLMNTLPATAADVVGSQVTFTAAISGVSLIYQWQRISGGQTNDISGATNVTLTLNNLQLADTASYQLQASNANGVAVSAPGSLTVSSVPAPVNNVIAEFAAQTGLGPSDAVNLPFTPTWTIPSLSSLIAGQSPTTALGNFSEEISSRNVNSLTAGGDQSLTVVKGDAGITTSPNYVTCGNGGGAGSFVIYTLTGAASGYNLTNIMVYGGWGDAGRDQQAYTVYYSTMDAPSTYKLLRSVSYNPSNPASVQSATRATLIPASGPLATNVATVKFDFTSPASENGYVGYSQILILGEPTIPPAVPTSVAAELADSGDLVMNVSDMVTGRNYEIQSTTNLASGVWITETNFVATQPTFMFTNATTNYPQNFYRVIGY